MIYKESPLFSSPIVQCEKDRGRVYFRHGYEPKPQSKKVINCR